MILWRKIEIIHFYHFDSHPRFPSFLLYVRWKSGVTFVQGCLRDVFDSWHVACQLPFMEVNLVTSFKQKASAANVV